MLREVSHLQADIQFAQRLNLRILADNFVEVTPMLPEQASNRAYPAINDTLGLVAQNAPQTVASIMATNNDTIHAKAF